MSADCGVARDPDGLKRAAEVIVDLTDDAAALPDRDVASYEVRNLLRVARAIVAAAAAREESRGAHTRTDVPHTDDRWLGRLVLHGDASPRFVALATLAAREQT
jgi:L-aspartate oxidase